MNDPDLDALFTRWVARHVTGGDMPDPAEWCRDRPELAGPLARLIDDYRRVSDLLDGVPRADTREGASPAADWPEFPGFRTVERLGAGGSGEVYKLHDLTLNRVVAAKVLRGDRLTRPLAAGFVDEARALARLQDPRIVQVYEFRRDATPPVLIMEYVDGFDLGRVGRSLEHRQRARLMKDVCEAVHHAHGAGLQHRDLKPSNIMVDVSLRPKILDFGLSDGNPSAGHFKGTPQYLAPEQLDPAAPIDARTDVYGLGAVLYELVCGVPPVDGADTEAVIDAVRRGAIRLPADVDPGVPEPLQAIALKALERSPADRYASAADMADDLGRYLDGRPVLARPSQYASALALRVRTHLRQVDDWLHQRLIHPHEAGALRSAYGQLARRDDDWIGEARSLTFSQIALYLGAFVLMCGSLFYFAAHRVYGAVQGVGRPFVVLGLPFIGLNLAAHLLERRHQRAVAVAFYLGGVSLLPLFLLILFHETGLWVVAADTAGQLFQDGSVSNRQLQVTVWLACAWTAWLSFRTRTVAMSTVLAALVLLFVLALLADAGLRTWIEESRWDRLSLHLMPLVLMYAVAGVVSERTGRGWFSRPCYTGAGVLLMVVLELFALDGRMFAALGVSLQAFQPAGVSDPLRLDTLAALSLNGLVFYGAASLAERYGSDLARTASWLLFTFAPFAVLEPLARLSQVGEYPPGVDWAYLAAALVAAFVSHRRQRRSFYYAGLVNSGVAFYLIADHRHWLDSPVWGTVLVAGGLAVLVGGFVLDARERRRVRPGGRHADERG